MEDLPEAFRGIRIVQISDIHLGSWPSDAKLETVVSLVNGLAPDLVLFTGDLVNARPEKLIRINLSLKDQRKARYLYHTR